MEQFIAEKKVSTVVVLDEKTPAGSEMVQVWFSDQTSEIMPKKRFEVVVSDKLSDATTVQKKFTEGVGGMLFGLLHEYGVKWGEVNPIGDAMIAFVDQGYAKAHDILWKCEKLDIPLIEINNILVKNYVGAQKSTDGTSSTGSGSDK